MKYYIEIKYSKHSHEKVKETLVLNYDNSRAAINAAVRKATYYDVDCEISEILVRTKL